MSPEIEIGDRIRHAYRNGSGGGHAKDGTVVRVEATMFVVAFDDGQRVWFERADLSQARGASGGFSLTPVPTPQPVKVTDRDPMGALARLRAYLLDVTDGELGIPDDPHALVQLTIASHASLRERASAGSPD
jgi:hypothetical protein